MKTIHFLENDYKCPASDEDIRAAKRRLKYMGVDTERINDILIHYQFGLMEKDAVYKIIFDKNNILATYSMYVSGSDSDFLYLIAAAGRNEVTGITYLDTSGQLVEFLNRAIRDDVKNLRSIVCGINSNKIITFDHECEKYVKRIKIQFNGMYDDCVVLEDFDIQDIDN
jgi:hypothetical protein